MSRTMAIATRVANTRLVAYRKGRSRACTKTAPRRIQRSAKLWAFQAKKATGRTVLRLSRLPSTRQKTGVAGPPFCLDSCKTGLLRVPDSIRLNPYCNQCRTAGASLSCSGLREANGVSRDGLRPVLGGAQPRPHTVGLTGKGRRRETGGLNFPKYSS